MSSRRDQQFNKLQRNVVAAEEAIASQQIEDFLLGAEVDFY
jgi:5-formaminoimidazole-4-carboxamide-1-beta-D-ribofuranosyl 5'-monophosphate synthetase